jgi:hypothetical protein
MSDDMDGLIAVVTVGVLDQPLGPVEKVPHVGREPRVVARDPDVPVTNVARLLERFVHGLVEGCALGLPVVLDPDVHAPLVSEALGHRLRRVGLVPHRQELCWQTSEKALGSSFRKKTRKEPELGHSGATVC